MPERVRQVWPARCRARWGALAFLLLACGTVTEGRGTARTSEPEAPRYPPPCVGACDPTGSAGNSAASGAWGSNPGVPHKEWTLAFYLASETSNAVLGDHYVDWLERRYAELEPFANVIVLLDGFYPTKLLQIRSNHDSDEVASEIPAPAGTALAQLFERTDDNELLLSTPEVLKAFLDLAQSDYPSKYFALTVLDHGEAWNGAVYDYPSDGPQDLLGPMPLADFADVFTSLARPIDVLAFDACVMQEVTTHSWWFKSGGNVRHVVGSEQNNIGWNIDKVLRQFNGLWRAEGGLSPRALATAFVGQTNEGDYHRNVTESAVDLTAWPGVAQRLDALGASLLEVGGMNDPIVKAVVDERVTRPYGTPVGERMSQEDLVDAVEFCEVLERSFGPDTPIARAASALRSAIGQAVMANSARRPEGDPPDTPNAAADVSHGISLHLPKTDTIAKLAKDAYTKKLGRVRELFPRWIEFLNTI